MSPSGTSTSRTLLVRGATVGATTAVASGLGSLAAAAVFARAVLTPDRNRPDDTMVRSVEPGRVTLGVTADCVVPGHYGLWLAGGAGHARLGELLGVDESARTVTRAVLGVDRGELTVGSARWNNYYFGLPPDKSINAHTEFVNYATELGHMPAWVVPPQDGVVGERWAVLVHGRGARREETIRAMPTLRRQGWTCLTPHYRNDLGVPKGPGGRYNLGLSEWRDIESAMRYAVARGAREILLVGWSMGGAIVMQVLDRSDLAGLVTGVVLDAPVLDWANVLDFHARRNHLPPALSALARTMMGRTWGRHLVGIHDVLDVAATAWVRRSAELQHPMLIIHSAEDEFVPVGPSRRLAQARPDLVTFEEWQVARHCKEWNVDPVRWANVVGAFVSR